MLSVTSYTPGTDTRKDLSSAAALASTSSSSCCSEYATLGLARRSVVWNSRRSTYGSSPMLPRHARSISAGDASRNGRSLRWTLTPARWLPLGSSVPVREDRTLPTRTLTLSTDSPGSCRFIARAASAICPAAATVVPNGVPTGRCRSTCTLSGTFIASSKRMTRTRSEPTSSRAKSSSAAAPASVAGPWRTDHDTAGTTVRSRIPSIRAHTRSCSERSGSRLQRPSPERWAGRMQSASSNDTASTKKATYGNTFTSWVTVAVTKRKGTNARTVVQAPMVIGPITARAPAAAASTPRLPLSRSVAMLSPTTTASSTTSPTIRKKPTSVPMFRVRLAGPKNISEPMKDRGMPSAIQMAARRSNTRRSRTNTRPAPATPFLVTADNRSRAGRALSFQTPIRTSRGAS